MPRGLFYEDFEVGAQITTAARTVTQADIVSFACLTGDFNEVHTDWEYCKGTPFGEPIAHGLLVYGIATGLVYASGVNEGTLLALLEMDNWRAVHPVKHGDTIRLVATVQDKRETSKPDRGIVRFRREVLNQHGTTVQYADVSLMYRRRPVLARDAASLS